MFSKRGFTFVEFMIVVAIIAILAAIAVPNFLDAHQRVFLKEHGKDAFILKYGIERYNDLISLYPHAEPEEEPSVPSIVSITIDDTFASDDKRTERINEVLREKKINPDSVINVESNGEKIYIFYRESE